MNQLDSLIDDIETHINDDNIATYKIRNKKALIKSLKDLNNIIGMQPLKDSVASQIRYLMTISKDNKSQKMLNTVLYGPPGTGKTTVGKLLAKIWYSLGYLNPTKSQVQKPVYSYSSEKENTNLLIYVAIIAFYMLYYIFIFMKFIYHKVGPFYLILLTAIMIIIVYILYNKYLKNKISLNTVTAGETSTPKPGLIDDDNSLIKIVSRDDFVAGYLGQTALKTKALLESTKGKVLFIDEAYSLLHDPRDSFGMEAITTLNLYMSEHPNDTIVIFAGYKNLLQKGIFKAQPGLPRRCMWHFECTPYNANELFEIFKRQLKVDKWSLNNENNVLTLFENNIDAFPNFGGDTERLVFYCQLEYTKDHFASSKLDKTLSTNQVQRGISQLRSNNIHTNTKDEINTSSFGTDNLFDLLKSTTLNQNKTPPSKIDLPKSDDDSNTKDEPFIPRTDIIKTKELST